MFGWGGRWSGILLGALVTAAVVTGTQSSDVASSAPAFVALSAPARLVDTRPGSATVDGQFAGIGLRPADSTLELTVAGRAGLPGDVASVVLNVTAVDTTDWGFVTVHPTGTARPNASNLNYVAGDTIANAVITRVGDDGKISLYTYATSHLLVDVTGYLPAGSFGPLPAPARLLDTRPGTTTIDGAFAGIGLRPAGSTLQLNVAGRAGISDDAVSVVLNVTAVIPADWGYLTVHPTGTARPNASNVNYIAGQTIANTVITRLGTDGQISIYTHAATHLIVDVAGHFPADTFTPLPAPRRLIDTRIGSATIDGQQAGIGLRPMSSTLQVIVADRAGVPADASAVVLNVAAVDPYGWGYLTHHPTGTSRPNASNLNYTAGQTIANTVISRLGAGGDVCVYTYGATHLIVDVAGYLTGPPPSWGPPCPSTAYGEPQFLRMTPNATWAEAADLNNSGTILGTMYYGSAEHTEATWWPSPNKAPLPLPVALGETSYAVAVNDHDQALVTSYSGPTRSGVFVVDLRTGWQSELVLTGQDHPSAVGLNDRLDVAMTVSKPWPAQGDEYAMVWNAATGTTDTDAALVGDEVRVEDIDDFGNVVGSVNGVPYFWDRTSDSVQNLNIQGAQLGTANVINNRGQILGAISFDGSDYDTALWQTRSAEPVLPPGMDSATDLNEAGLVIGNGWITWDGNWCYLPFLWDSDTNATVDVDPTTCIRATVLSDAGQILGRSNDGPVLWSPT